MKKILFVTRLLHTGGIEKSLYETIQIIKSEDVKITIAVFVEKGDMVDLFSKECDIIDLSKDFQIACNKAKYLFGYLSNLRFISFLKGVFTRLYEMIFVSQRKKEMRRISRMPILKEEFDIAVSYHDPYSRCVPYVSNNVIAKEKYTWVHRDVMTDPDTRSVKLYGSIFNNFKKIICVSKAAEESFLKHQPLCAGKTEVVYNPIDVNAIVKMSKEDAPPTDEQDIKICSVGRLHIDKGIDLAIKACRDLKTRGHRIKWLVCGEGPNRGEFESLIQKNNLENEFILLGNQNNPYKYIAWSDIYVQPSRTESYCLTIAEARALKKPIVTTNFPASYEHITDGTNGFITEMTSESIANAIEKLILSPELRNKFSENTTPVDDDYTKLRELFQ